jgi:hypothetical protein
LQRNERIVGAGPRSIYIVSSDDVDLLHLRRHLWPPRDNLRLRRSLPDIHVLLSADSSPSRPTGMARVNPLTRR